MSREQGCPLPGSPNRGPGLLRSYRPDFNIAFKNGIRLILEEKEKESEQDKAKRQALKEWVKAVNSCGGFGTWESAVSTNPGDIVGIINKLCI